VPSSSKRARTEPQRSSRISEIGSATAVADVESLLTVPLSVWDTGEVAAALKRVLLLCIPPTVLPLVAAQVSGNGRPNIVGSSDQSSSRRRSKITLPPVGLKLLRELESRPLSSFCTGAILADTWECLKACAVHVSSQFLGRLSTQTATTRDLGGCYACRCLSAMAVIGVPDVVCVTSMLNHVSRALEDLSETELVHAMMSVARFTCLRKTPVAASWARFACSGGANLSPEQLCFALFAVSESDCRQECAPLVEKVVDVIQTEGEHLSCGAVLAATSALRSPTSELEKAVDGLASLVVKRKALWNSRAAIYLCYNFCRGGQREASTVFDSLQRTMEAGAQTGKLPPRCAFMLFVCAAELDKRLRPSVFSGVQNAILRNIDCLVPQDVLQIVRCCDKLKDRLDVLHLLQAVLEHRLSPLCNSLDDAAMTELLGVVRTWPQLKGLADLCQRKLLGRDATIRLEVEMQSLETALSSVQWFLNTWAGDEHAVSVRFIATALRQLYLYNGFAGPLSDTQTNIVRMGTDVLIGGHEGLVGVVDQASDSEVVDLVTQLLRVSPPSLAASTFAAVLTAVGTRPGLSAELCIGICDTALDVFNVVPPGSPGRESLQNLVTLSLAMMTNVAEEVPAEKGLAILAKLGPAHAECAASLSSVVQHWRLETCAVDMLMPVLLTLGSLGLGSTVLFEKLLTAIAALSGALSDGDVVSILSAGLSANLDPPTAQILERLVSVASLPQESVVDAAYLCFPVSRQERWQAKLAQVDFAALDGIRTSRAAWVFAAAGWDCPRELLQAVHGLCQNISSSSMACVLTWASHRLSSSHLPRELEACHNAPEVDEPQSKTVLAAAGICFNSNPPSDRLRRVVLLCEENVDSMAPEQALFCAHALATAGVLSVRFVDSLLQSASAALTNSLHFRTARFASTVLWSVCRFGPLPPLASGAVDSLFDAIRRFVPLSEYSEDTARLAWCCAVVASQQGTELVNAIRAPQTPVSGNVASSSMIMWARAKIANSQQLSVPEEGLLLFPDAADPDSLAALAFACSAAACSSRVWQRIATAASRLLTEGRLNVDRQLDVLWCLGRRQTLVPAARVFAEQMQRSLDLSGGGVGVCPAELAILKWCLSRLGVACDPKIHEAIAAVLPVIGNEDIVLLCVLTSETTEEAGRETMEPLCAELLGRLCSLPWQLVERALYRFVIPDSGLGRLTALQAPLLSAIVDEALRRGDEVEHGSACRLIYSVGGAAISRDIWRRLAKLFADGIRRNMPQDMVVASAWCFVSCKSPYAFPASKAALKSAADHLLSVSRDFAKVHRDIGRNLLRNVVLDALTIGLSALLFCAPRREAHYLAVLQLLGCLLDQACEISYRLESAGRPPQDGFMGRMQDLSILLFASHVLLSSPQADDPSLERYKRRCLRPNSGIPKMCRQLAGCLESDVLDSSSLARYLWCIVHIPKHVTKFDELKQGWGETIRAAVMDLAQDSSRIQPASAVVLLYAVRMLELPGKSESPFSGSELAELARAVGQRILQGLRHELGRHSEADCALATLAHYSFPDSSEEPVLEALSSIAESAQADLVDDWSDLDASGLLGQVGRLYMLDPPGVVVGLRGGEDDWIPAREIEMPVSNPEGPPLPRPELADRSQGVSRPAARLLDDHVASLIAAKQAVEGLDASKLTDPESCRELSSRVGESVRGLAAWPELESAWVKVVDALKVVYDFDAGAGRIALPSKVVSAADNAIAVLRDARSVGIAASKATAPAHCEALEVFNVPLTCMAIHIASGDPTGMLDVAEDSCDALGPGEPWKGVVPLTQPHIPPESAPEQAPDNTTAEPAGVEDQQQYTAEEIRQWQEQQLSELQHQYTPEEIAAWAASSLGDASEKQYTAEELAEWTAEQGYTHEKLAAWGQQHAAAEQLQQEASVLANFELKSKRRRK